MVPSRILRDRGVLGLARDLVQLVHVHDAVLGVHHVEVGGLEQAHEDVLHVLAHVAGLGEAGGVHDGEGDLEGARQRAREQRLAGSGRADQEDVRLLQLDVLDRAARIDPLVVVVDRDAHRLLGALLPDDVVVEDLLDLGRLGKRALGRSRATIRLPFQDVVAELHALAADVDRGTGDQTRNLVLAAAAEAAPDGVRRIDPLLHARGPSRPEPARPFSPCWVRVWR